MSLYALHLTNGRTSAPGASRLIGRLLTGSGVIESTAFTVSATTPTADMTVKVSGSATSDNLVIVTATGDTYYIYNTSQISVTIQANSSGVTKTDAIVVYADTAFTTTTPDNPGGAQVLAVRRSGSLTGAPTNAEIDTATGNKPWIQLATVTVGNGVTSINSGNITSSRSFIGFTSGLVGQAALATGAIYLTHASITSGFSTASASAVQVTGLTATITAPAARRMKVSVVGYAASNNTADTGFEVQLWDGAVGSGTRIAVSAGHSSYVGANCPVALMAIVAQTTGSKTYNVSLQAVGGGTATLSAVATGPSTILVEAL